MAERLLGARSHAWGPIPFTCISAQSPALSCPFTQLSMGTLSFLPLEPRAWPRQVAAYRILKEGLPGPLCNENRVPLGSVPGSGLMAPTPRLL